jgi:hypothetical protein
MTGGVSRAPTATATGASVAVGGGNGRNSLVEEQQRPRNTLSNEDEARELASIRRDVASVVGDVVQPSIQHLDVLVACHHSFCFISSYTNHYPCSICLPTMNGQRRIHHHLMRYV